MSLSTLMPLSHLMLGLALFQAPGDDWPHIRGPGLDGRADRPGLFDGEDVGFVPSWTATLGSSYSGVVVGQGAVLTAFSDGSEDVLAAFEEDTGKERWRLSLGPTYRGRDGSDDGVVSNPVLGEGRVFLLTPGGQLLAALIADGEVQWSVDLAESLGAPQPEHGFGSSPILEDGRLIVHVGGPHSLCAFDPEDGALLWTRPEGEVWYQSPLAMDLAGRRQLVILAQKSIQGLAPEDGSVLWSHPLGERDDADEGIACPVDEHRFFAAVSGQIAMFEVLAEGEAFAVRQLWKSRELGRSYASPVFHDEHIYGFKNDFLTCLDASNGRRVWKSRPPGGRGLIGIEDRLLVFGAQGVAALVRATPEGYVEEDRIAALGSTGYSWPSFAGGALFVRNLDALARVELRDRAAAGIEAQPTLSAAEDPTDAPAFARFSALVSEAGFSLDQVAEFLAAQPHLPVVRDGFVHLLFEGEVEDVAVAFSGRDGSAVYPMRRLADGKHHYKGFAIQPAQRYEYRFQVDFDRWTHDPGNPQRSPGMYGPAEMSGLATEGFVQRAPFAGPEPAQRGRLDEFEFRSEQLDNTRKIQVYTPAGYDQGEEALPLLIVQQGSDWVDRGLLPQTLDRCVGRSVRPLVVAFLDPIGPWWQEAGGTGTDAFLDALSTEFLDELRRRYRVSTQPADIAVLGTRGFGLTAVYAALRHPGTFGQAAAQSIDLGDTTQYPMFALIEQGAAPKARFYMDWNRLENRNIDRGFDKRDDSQRLFAALQDKGYPVSGGEERDSFGWGSWRSRSDHLLEALFPLQTGGEGDAPIPDEEADTPDAPPLVVSISVDWEGSYVLNPNVQAMAALRERFEEIPLTHFLNATYFVRAEDQEEREDLRSRIEDTLRPDDEIGMHVHCWQSLVEGAGVEFRDQPTYFGGRSRARGGGERGHDVELDAYERDEVESILRFGKQTLQQQGYEVSASFRCPAWLASPKILDATRAAGFLVDSSATDSRWHREELRGLPLLDRLDELWPQVDSSTQPFVIDTPSGAILEMPDTGALADYIDGEEMIEHLEAALAEVQPGQRRFAHIGFHHETAQRFVPRIVECLEHFRGDPRVAFITLQDAAALHRAQAAARGSQPR